MAQCRPITTAIGAIKDSAISLCVAINAEAPHRVGHRGLVTELRLFAGALFSLETLAAELELVSAQQTDAPSLHLLNEFNLLLQSAHTDCTSDSFSAGRVDQLKQDARTARSKVTYVLARTQSVADLTLLLSLSNQTSAIGSDAHHMLDCLQMLSAAYNNRQPLNHYLERIYLEARRSELPEYSHAALTWPDSVEEHWSVVGQHVERLFTPPPKSYNFVQWALEYARETWPNKFGLHCADPGPLLDLSHDLCDGLVTPLHLAAALGLPSLCKSLLASGANPDQAGCLGSPLYCALVGQDVICTGSSPESWTSVLHRGPRLAARHAVVRQLLDAGADCSWQYRWSSAGETSLAGVAFWFSCLVNDHTVFERILTGGATIHDDFAFLVADSDFMDRLKPRKSTLALLVTCAFDQTYACDGNCPWQREDSVLQALQHLMSEHELDFAHGLGRSKRLHHVPDDEYNNIFQSALLDGEIIQLKRLVLDPRFKPIIPVGSGRNYHATVAHFAAEGSDVEVLDLLFSAGTDFSARDSHGRTPLLAIERTYMLARLLEFGLPSTDTDNSGGNIWHLAAASGDVELLEWLKDNDPSRDQNLKAIDSEGHSPLEKSLLYVQKTRYLSRPHLPGGSSGRPRPPDLVFAVLNAGAVCQQPALIPYIPLAVEWGSADLVKRLVSVGAEARACDSLGSNALHYLTLSADAALVSLTQDLCKGLALEGRGVDTRGTPHTAYGEWHDPSGAELTPAETIFTNTALHFPVYQDGYLSDHVSCHPSCAAPLSQEVYTLLLTPDILEYRDRQGRCTWTRFCYHAVSRLLERSRDEKSCTPSPYYSISLVNAVHCLARRGALERYEATTGRAAVLCLREEAERGANNGDVHGEVDVDGIATWPDSLVVVAKHVLKAHKSRLADEFLSSPEGIKLKARSSGTSSPAKATF
ncbi:hypothetical protein HIM_02964 [Hirsutella minnesotensis 3608]|nr:hypothetical protein HIM_02964 [Hirsutella minnesotensis 3608]